MNQSTSSNITTGFPANTRSKHQMSEPQLVMEQFLSEIKHPHAKCKLTYAEYSKIKHRNFQLRFSNSNMLIHITCMLRSNIQYSITDQ